MAGDPQVKTIFTADATSAKRGAKEAADAVDTSAERQKQSVGKLTQFVKAAAGGFGFVTAVKLALQLGDAIKRIGEEAERTGREIAAIGVAATQSLGTIGTGEQDELEKSIAKTRELTNKAITEIQTKADELKAASDTTLGNASNPFDFLVRVYKKGANAITGASDAVEAQAKATAAQIEGIKKQELAAIERLEAQAAAKKKAAEQKLVDESIERANKLRDETAKIEAGLIDDAEERARALFRIEQKAQAERLKEAKTAEERDALFALGKAKFAAYQAELTKIVEDEEARRAEAVARSVAEQIAEYEALQGAIDSAFQAQQQFSQSLTSGFGSDIKAIRQLLEIRGGWKK